MNDFRTKCGRCGKRIRVMAGTKKRRCVQCDLDDGLLRMRRCTCESFGNGVISGNGGLLPPGRGCPRHGSQPVFDVEPGQQPTGDERE